jgi:hypothetical protein
VGPDAHGTRDTIELDLDLTDVLDKSFLTSGGSDQ